MTQTTQNQARPMAKMQKGAVAALAAVSLSATLAEAQAAIGVPFVGRNHLSFSVTPLSRDGITEEQAAVYGGVYGRRLGSDAAPVQYSVLVRVGARALEGTNDGIADAGFTLAATHQVRMVEGLSFTGSLGMGAKVWAREATAQVNDRARVITTTPISAGVAYDIRVGRATIAPFAMLSGTYSDERDYENDQRIARRDGWRLGHSAGVSVRFREVVMSLSGVNRERGLPNSHRAIFSAGMSW